MRSPQDSWLALEKSIQRKAKACGEHWSSWKIASGMMVYNFILNTWAEFSCPEIRRVWFLEQIAEKFKNQYGLSSIPRQTVRIIVATYTCTIHSTSMYPTWAIFWSQVPKCKSGLIKLFMDTVSGNYTVPNIHTLVFCRVTTYRETRKLLLEIWRLILVYKWMIGVHGGRYEIDLRPCLWCLPRYNTAGITQCIFSP